MWRFIGGFLFLCSLCVAYFLGLPLTSLASIVPSDTVGLLPPEVRYGQELILHTADYLGPQGTVGKYLGNKMNCDHCHLDRGTRQYGNDFVGSAFHYPQYRAREGRVLTLAERVNNCITRPHNGNPLPLDSREMQAIVAYIHWVGTHANRSPEFPRWIPIQLPKRAASPARGKHLYIAHCQRCHGPNGEGKLLENESAYLFPPLWGRYSFAKGSSMARILNLAPFIKANMPYGTKWKKPVLSDNEAFDLAAFILDSSQHSRPGAVTRYDYPFIDEKPVDFPFGPFEDPFSVEQHRFGPFQPIIEFRKSKKLALTGSATIKEEATAKKTITQ